jgi:hypothetical protein
MPTQTTGDAPKGLAASRFANAAGDDENGDAANQPTEGEAEPDHSSAALASLAKVQESVSQLQDYDAQLGSQHHEMLKSITDLKNES